MVTESTASTNSSDLHLLGHQEATDYFAELARPGTGLGWAYNPEAKLLPSRGGTMTVMGTPDISPELCGASEYYLEDSERRP